MKILVTGAKGFIGSYIISALYHSGHQPVVAQRATNSAHCPLNFETTSIDLGIRYTQVEWSARLKGIDVVINCAGILRESRSQKFSRIHFEGPKSLLDACIFNGVEKFIQISALGDSEDNAFIRSKYQFDDYLQTLDLDWTIIRPSVVYSPSGSYGGTSLLRALSILPWLIFVPGDGTQKLQPISARDLAQSVVGTIANPQATGKIIHTVGPEFVTLSDFLKYLRRWLTRSPARIVKVPLILVKAISCLGDWLGTGPLNMTLFRMLQKGNIGAARDVEFLAQCTGIHPRSVKDVLSGSPAQSQDRLHARLYFLGPLLRFSLAFLWIASGIVGLSLSAETQRPVRSRYCPG